MGRPSNNLKNRRNLLADTRKKRKISKKYVAKKYSRYVPGSAMNILSLIHKTVYMPDFRKMEIVQLYTDRKVKLSPSLLYSQIHSKSRTYLKEEMDFGKFLHYSFSQWLKSEKEAVVDFPSGISTSEFYWISLKPDGIFPTTEGLVLIELKTISQIDYENYTKTKEGQYSLPDKVTYQIQSYMNILKISVCLLCLYCYEDGSHLIIEIERDTTFSEILIHSHRTFIKLLFWSEGVKAKDIPKEAFQIQTFRTEDKMINYKGAKTKTDLKRILKMILVNMQKNSKKKVQIQKIKDERQQKLDQEMHLNEIKKERGYKNKQRRREYFKKQYGRRERG